MVRVRLLAYVTGTVDQGLLARNEYLTTQSGIINVQLAGESSTRISASRKSPPGNDSATAPKHASTGYSPPKGPRETPPS